MSFCLFKKKFLERPIDSFTASTDEMARMK